MKRCPKCKVFVNTERKTCPLCFAFLQDGDGPDEKLTPYPKYKSKIFKYNLFFRSLVFFSIIGIFVSVVVNVLTYRDNPNPWSIIVISGLLYFWILLRSTVRREGNIPRQLMVQSLTLSLLLYIIDLLSGNIGWSLNYVIPFLSMSSLLSIISILLGNTLKFNDYVSALFAAAILGFIPFILWLFQVVEELWPSLAAASLSFSTIIGMFIFAGRNIKEELKKRFHI